MLELLLIERLRDPNAFLYQEVLSQLVLFVVKALDQVTLYYKKEYDEWVCVI